MTKKELRRRRSSIITNRTKVLKPIETAIAQAEEDIALNERLVEELNQALMEASQSKDGARIGDLARDLHQSQQIIDKRFDALEKLYQDLEEHSAGFQEKLDQLAQDEQGADVA
jgi:ATP-binding cassette subfamily F protein 3